MTTAIRNKRDALEIHEDVTGAQHILSAYPT
jgi:hypothetical protein